MPVRSPVAKSLALFVALMAATAHAAEPRVRDGGNFFSPPVAAEASSKLEAIQQRGASVIVETFPEAPAEIRSTVAGTDKAARDNAFGQFGRTRATSLKADVYLLVSRNPMHLRLLVDSAARSAGLAPAQRDEIARNLIAAFDGKEYDRGLTEAVAAMDASLTKSVAQNGPQTSGAAVAGSRTADASTPAGRTAAPPVPASTTSSFSCLSIGLLALVVLVVVAIFRSFANRGRQQYGGPAQNQNRFDPQTGQPYDANQPQQGFGGGGAGGGGGGGFGRGIAGGVLGGLLGGYLGNQAFGNHSNQSNNDPNDAGGGSAGGAFGGGSDAGSNDAGASDGGSSDYGDSGGDFGGGDSSGGDFGGD